MAKNPIQWFPGHMAKTRRLMQECLTDVDIVLEILDARIPESSKNPEINKLVMQKPKLAILTKASLADADTSASWIEYYKSKNERVVLIDSQSGYGITELEAAVKDILHEKIQRYKDKGMQGRSLKAMIVGIPNVGKSSLINRLAKSNRAKVENRPGVTLNKQWVKTDMGFDLLDMPGVLWPKFEDARVGENLALTGAIKDGVIDTEELAMILCSRLMKEAPECFMQRYRLSIDECQGLDGYDLFELVGRKRGLLISGGEVNHKRCADMLLNEFRSAQIGRISLEKPNV